MKINKIIITIVILLVFLVLSYFFNLGNTVEEENNVCFEKDCFFVEVVDTPDQRQRGLMFRETLDRNAGMLFIFERSGVYQFWMKNTLIPLDIIWIDEEKKVVFISEKTQPCEEDPCASYNPGVPAFYVFEINGGLSEELGIDVGDKVVFRNN